MILYTGETVAGGLFNLGAMVARGRKQRFAITGTVTPAMAIEMLKKNTRNRRLVDARVRQHANSMALGMWMLTCDAIAFDKEGVMLDGQHRLNGVVLSNKPVCMTIWFGCETEEFEVSGADVAPRTAAQVMAMKGYHDTVALCAVARLVSIIKHESVKSVGEQWRYAEGIDQNIAQAGMRLAPKGKSIGSISTLTLAYYHIASNTKYGTAKILQFWECLTTGAGVTDKKFLNFRLRLVTDKIKSRGSYTTQVKVAGQIVEAWNAFVNQKSVNPSWDDPNNLPSVL